MKKILSIFIAMALLINSLVACGSTDTKQVEQSDNKDIKIVATIFPIYDWVKNILGEKFNKDNLSILLDNSVDLHNYQPTSADMIKISNSDLFIYVGGESDEWVEDVLSQVQNENLKTVNLLELLGKDARIEEEKEGMEEDHEEHEEEYDEAEEMEYDEHVWLSLKNAKKLVPALSNYIKELDPENANLYESNTLKYIEDLQSLDNAYRDMVNIAQNKMLIFGDRFPFLYMVKDYGLDYYAAFKGCSAETEASFKTIAFLTQKLDEYNLDYIMTIEGIDHKIAETIIENSNNKNRTILELNSMQSTTTNDINAGANYIDIMKKNLEVLKNIIK